MSTDNPKPDVDELQAQLEHTREELADTVDALAAKLDVKSRVGDQVDDVKAKVGDRVEGVKEGVKEKVSQTKDKVVDAASHAKDTVATQAHRVTDSVGSGSGASGAEDGGDSALSSRSSGAPTSSSRPEAFAGSPRPAVGAHRAPTNAPASSLSTEAIVALGGLAVAAVGVVRYVATRR